MARKYTKAERSTIMKKFLASFRRTGNKQKSATVAGVSYRSLLYWIQNDTKFSKKVTAANVAYLRSKA